MTPLFVLGKHRSGTTWLANLLAAHSDVAAQQHVAHSGVHETGFYTHWLGRYGPLTSESARREFSGAFAACDTATLIGSPGAATVYEWTSGGYLNVLERVLERAATPAGARYSLEKTPGHTPHVARIAQDFATARFVAIVREPHAALASAMAAGSASGGGLGRRDLLREAAAYEHYRLVIDEFVEANPHRIVSLRYEDLVEDPARELAAICRFLELVYQPQMLADPYRVASSHRGPREELSVVQRRLADLTMAGVRAMPSAVRDALGRAGRVDTTRSALPDHFYRLAGVRSAGDNVSNNAS